MNNKERREVRQTGIGFCGVLGIVFIVLKLCDKIAWSWWWVTAPFWMPFVATVIILCVLVLAALIDDKIEQNRIIKSIEDKYKKGE